FLTRPCHRGHRCEADCRMSAFGTKRTCRSHLSMSAFGGIANIDRKCREVRSWPKACRPRFLGQAVLREKIHGEPRAFLWLLDLQEMSRARDKAVIVAALGAECPVSGAG